MCGPRIRYPGPWGGPSSWRARNSLPLLRHFKVVIRIVSGITIVLVGCVVWCFFNGEVLEGKEEVVAPSCLSPILLFLLVCL